MQPFPSLLASVCLVVFIIHNHNKYSTQLFLLSCNRYHTPFPINCRFSLFCPLIFFIAVIFYVVLHMLLSGRPTRYCFRSNNFLDLRSLHFYQRQRLCLTRINQSKAHWESNFLCAADINELYRKFIPPAKTLFLLQSMQLESPSSYYTCFVTIYNL